MNDLPRQSLTGLITRFGTAVIEDPRRFEALMRDYAGQYRREVNALVSALRERVPQDLKASSGGMPKEVLIGRLSSRLDQNLGLAPDVARWAVETWALALGVIAEADLRPPAPSPGQSPEPEPVADPPQPPPVSQPPPAKQPPISPQAFAILLWAPGQDRSAAVAAVRQVTSLDAGSASVLLDSAPVNIIEGIDRAEAESLADMLRASGATVDVVPSSSATRRVPQPSSSRQQAQSTANVGPQGAPDPYPPLGSDLRAMFDEMFSATAPPVSAVQPRHTTVRTVAGSGIKGFADGPGPSAQFNGLKDVAVDARGVIYVADDGNRRIRAITPDGSVSTYAGTGTFRGSTRDGKLTDAGFFSPEVLDFDSKGSLYVGDVDKIRVIRADGVVETLSHESDLIHGLAIARDGVVYLTGKACLLSFAPNGTKRWIGVRGTTVGHKDGPADKAVFNYPSGLAFDATGALYVADTNNHRIRRVGLDGQVGTVAGKTNWLGQGGYADGPGAEARFNSPVGIVVAQDGRIYVADTDNHRIRRIDTDGTVSTIAGSGVRGRRDGPALTAEFNKPRGLALGPDGALYVADSDNHCVRAIGP